MIFNRVSIDESKDELKISIKTQRNRWFVFKTSFLLFFCYVAMVLMLAMFFISTPSLDWMLISILFGINVFWVSCCFYFTRALVWMALGKEVITITSKDITIEKKRGWGFPAQTYALSRLHKLQLASTPVIGQMLDIDVFTSPLSRAVYAVETGGRLKFDDGLKTVRFGNLLPNDEAEELRKKIIGFVAGHTKDALQEDQNIKHISRITVTETPDNLDLTIPGRRSIFLLVATSAWLLVWIVAVFFIAQEKPASVRTNASDWSLLAVSVFVFLIIVHMIMSKESLRFSRKGLRHHRQWNIHWPKHYDWSLIEDFRVEEELAYKKMVGVHSGKTSLINRPNWIWTIEVKDVITFNYKGKKVRIGRGIDEAEAKHLVMQILDKYQRS